MSSTPSVKSIRLARLASIAAGAMALALGPISLRAQAGPNDQGNASRTHILATNGPNADSTAAASAAASVTTASTDDAGASTAETHAAYTFESRADSLSWARNKAVAWRAKGMHIVVSLKDCHVWVLSGDDTLLSAPAAVASGRTLQFGDHEWTFDMPRGVRHVLGKEADPIWQPPLWLYAETAKEYGLKLGELEYGHPIKLEDGRLLEMKGDVAGVVQDGEFYELPTDEHIVFDNTLYVPPMGSQNRRVHGELGKYRLILGDGFLMHGTPEQDSIGLAATHGCVRLRDDDIEWMYDNVPVGTPVYIY